MINSSLTKSDWENCSIITLSNMHFFIFVEGDYDRMLIEKIIDMPGFPDNVEIVRYAKKKKEFVNSYIRTLNNQPYVFTADMDILGSCPKDIKEIVCTKYTSVGINNVAIIILEIESWCIAGLNQNAKTELQVHPRYYSYPENVSKEDFKAIAAKAKLNYYDLHAYCVDLFDIKVAKTRSNSLKYFLNKVKLAGA